MDNIIARELNVNDYEQFLRLINDFRQTNFTEEQFKEILKNFEKDQTTKIFVIEKDSNLIATATLIIEQKFIYNLSKLAHIEDVCVKKEMRKQGYGKLIINKIIDEAKKIGCYKITLDCSNENISFYKLSNFAVRGNQMSQLI